MANRTYHSNMASRLTMADPEARAAVDMQANSEDVTGEAPDSDEDILESPGRASSHFIVHDDYAIMPQNSHSQSRRSSSIGTLVPSQWSSSDLESMDLDSIPAMSSAFRDQTTSEINAILDEHHSRSYSPESSSSDSSLSFPTLPELYSHVTRPLGPDSDRENISPPRSLPELDEDDSLVIPQIVTWSSDIAVPDFPKRVRPSSPFPTPANDPKLSHLREISGLASWTVSSYKPSCGVAALLNPSTATFWQSDGPQPHLLNIHFFKLVRIVKLRIYLDFELDESYTPTRLSFAAGTHEYDAVEFAQWHWEDGGPKGWVDVDLSQCGSNEERDRERVDEFDMEDPSIAGVLRCFFLQVRVLENHQNGKDTHIRGVQIFARDDRVKTMLPRMHDLDADERVEEVRQSLEFADWMGEPELR